MCEVVWVLRLEGGLGLQRWVWQAGACAAVCDRCALQRGNSISRGLLRSMVEADARIVAPVVAATERGIVCDGKTFDFETCEDAGYGFQSKVRCKGIGRERVVCVCVLHFRGEGGGC